MGGRDPVIIRSGAVYSTFLITKQVRNKLLPGIILGEVGRDNAYRMSINRNIIVPIAGKLTSAVLRLLRVLRSRRVRVSMRRMTKEGVGLCCGGER